jgi:hypothetical protein
MKMYLYDGRDLQLHGSHFSLRTNDFMFPSSFHGGGLFIVYLLRLSSSLFIYYAYGLLLAPHRYTPYTNYHYHFSMPHLF